MLNEHFFADMRSGMYKLGLSQAAVDGMNAICTAFDGFTGSPKCTDDLAAILATCYLETGPNLNLSVREVGKGAGRAYGEPTGPYNQVYYGRGPCQITWLANYTIAEKRTGVHFVQYPDMMVDPKYGIPYMIDAMYAGVFTKKALRGYITPGVVTTREQFQQARAIINGNDKAVQYADYCVQFQAALTLGYDKAKPPLAPTTPVTVPVAAAKPKGLLAAIAAWFHSKNG